MKLRKVAIISKFGSKESEKASIKVAKIFLGKKITVYTISPSSVPGTKTVEVTEDLKKEKIDLAITLGGDGTTLRAFRGLGNAASDKKPLMSKEPDCIFCLACEGVCPPKAIKIFENSS